MKAGTPDNIFGNIKLYKKDNASSFVLARTFNIKRTTIFIFPFVKGLYYSLMTLLWEN